MPRQPYDDSAPTAAQAKRTRQRRVVFSRQYEGPMSAAQQADLTTALDSLGGEYAWINHLLPNSHAQGVIRFPDKVDVSKIATKLGLGPEGVKPIGRDKFAFARCIQYLPHNGEYPDEAIISNFDWRAEVAKLPAPAAPTLTVLTRRVFDGELTPEQIADEWPDIYLRHAKKLEDAERRGDALREAKVADQMAAEKREAKVADWVAAEEREAERVAAVVAAKQREAERFDSWCAAADAWRASPEGKEHARREREKEAARRAEQAARHRAEAEAEWEANRGMWAIAFIAMDNAITGDAAKRESAVTTFLGRSPTYEACIEFMHDDFGWPVAECEDQIATLRREVAAQNNGSLGAWLRIGDPDEQAYKYLLELKSQTEKYPDLYQFRPKPVNPGGCIPAEWIKELKSTNTNKKEK